jgi:hypothetical protein
MGAFHGGAWSSERTAQERCQGDLADADAALLEEMPTGDGLANSWVHNHRITLQ